MSWAAAATLSVSTNMVSRWVAATVHMSSPYLAEDEKKLNGFASVKSYRYKDLYQLLHIESGLFLSRQHFRLYINQFVGSPLLCWSGDDL
jgi:hypothetical protein